MQKPDFPGKGGPAPRFPGQLPEIWNIGEARNPYFTGRDEILSRLHESLGAGKAAALTQAIQGLGGVGKTQLALEYAYRFASEYDGVWWLHAETPVTLASDYASLAPCLGVPVAADQGQMVREVRAALSQRQRMLLIFDNATEPRSLAPYLPLGRGVHVIVTTRAHAWPGAEPQEVQTLDLDQAVAFLVGRTKQDDRSAAENVAKRLGGLPLALEQAAAYVVSCEKPLADYSKLLAKHGLKVIERGQPFQYQASVGTTWELSFKKVEAKSPAAADLMRLCAFLAPEPIHMGDLAAAKDKLPPSLQALLADELALDEAIAVLLGYSLVRGEGRSLVIHRLVSEVMRSRMNEEDSERWLGAALKVVRAVFPIKSNDVRTWPTCSRWLAHALAVVGWGQAESVDAEACGVLLTRTGTHLYGRADYAQAELLMRGALKVDEISLGPNHPSIAADLNNLALLLQDTNRPAEAEPLYRRALGASEASLGPNHPDVAAILNSLALLLQATNRLAEAEPLFRRALSIAEPSLGPDDPTVATFLNNLASLLNRTNRLAEAEPLCRRALKIDEASLGPDHPSVATDLNNLALLLQATNRLAEGEPLHRRALKIDEASLGSDHPSVATDLNNLALLLKRTNRLAEAEPLFRRALKIDEASLGPHHPSVARDLNNLALLLQATSRFAEAEPLYRRALKIDEASLGPDHPEVARNLNNLASLLQATHRLAESEPLHRRALKINEASLGLDHPEVARNLNLLALLLQATSRFAEAEPLYRRALKIGEASLGPDHPEVGAYLNNLAMLLKRTNRLAEAEPLLRRALDIAETSLGPEHPNTITAHENLNILLAKVAGSTP